ncbi:MAG TPA: pyrimidine dimer DNA glycosylase/endonuclease V [Myxococcota bacterium]|nr:pyrimidine dimer DNA glycosylase/endonuclease V [Myxococcota bacterium]
MRLWTLHPRYLDARGLVALWREALLAKRVLQERTRGYRHHPQLERFRAHSDPLLAIDAYLAAVHGEAEHRGYSFDARKIGARGDARRIAVPRGQVAYEWRHLLAKLRVRDPARRRRLARMERPAPHPLFRIVAGDVASWERR